MQNDHFNSGQGKTSEKQKILGIMFNSKLINKMIIIAYIRQMYSNGSLNNVNISYCPEI